MIPKNIREGATAEGLDGERASFQIEANGKAFRTLIDGLYSNKVQAVIRELSSNAHDSHTEAGQDRPFEISIPTHLDPTFRVRDFGVSLTHDGVMNLYTTIFKSTKEETNTQTGQLGLGSKSPFAYTDTFSVVAYLHGVRRVYVAFLETDGVPCITHVGDTPSDEPDGLEVSFPAKREDMRDFQREMLRVALAYEPGQLLVHGLDVKLPKPRLSGDGWALYPTRDIGGYYSQQNYVRMGSVVYPIERYDLRSVSADYSAIIDIPIGQCDVTASRESLSMDDETRQVLREAVERVSREVDEQVTALIEKAANGSRVQRALANKEYGSITRHGGSFAVSLIAEANTNKHRLTADSNRIPGDVLEAAKYYGRGQNIRRHSSQRYISNLEVDYLNSVVVILDDTSQKLVRRFKRIKEFRGGHSNIWVFASNNPTEIRQARAWIKKCWELNDDQFVNSQDIPDCPPPKRAPGAPKAARVRKPNQLWMGRRYGSVVSEIYGEGDRGIGSWPYPLRDAANIIPNFVLDWDEVFWVNEREEKKMKANGELPDSHKLDVVVQRKAKAHAKRQPVTEAQSYLHVVETVGRYNSALPVVLEKFFPELKSMSPERANTALKIARTAGLDLQNAETLGKVKASVDTLADEFPLLFQKSGRDHFEKYIEAIKASKINNKEEVTA